MQVLSVPLRALLFCFEFVFGNGSRIKSCLTLGMTPFVHSSGSGLYLVGAAIGMDKGPLKILSDDRSTH